MADDAPADTRTLGRIAAALGVPIEELLSPGPDGGSVAEPSETLALLAAFARLRDPRTRARIIAEAEAAAQRMGTG